MENLQLAFIGGIGMTEILVVGGVALLLFGSNKLPELGRGLARGIKEFRDGIKGNPDSQDSPDPKEKKAESKNE
jgi:sec-independent protein translocase protein TatA